jgi:4'-phosphopantetheinyl transferase
VTGVVRVWIVPVDLPPQAAVRCREVLDDSERCRAAALANPRTRLEYEIGHGALRILAARELGASPAALRWARGRYGKPELTVQWPGLFTSLSHSGTLIAISVAVGRAVGVDIQRLVPGSEAAALSARFYPPAEAEYVTAAPDMAVRADRFTRLWSRKEAVVKAAGGRLWPNLRMAVLHRDVVICAEPPGAAYRVADITAPEDFRAAVAVAGAAPFVTESSSWPDEEEEPPLR